MIRGLVFDKDGTLFDFKTTWNAWSAGLIRRFSNGDPDREAALAAAAHLIWRGKVSCPAVRSSQEQTAKRPKFSQAL